MLRDDDLFDGNMPHASSCKSAACRSEDKLYGYACEYNRRYADTEPGYARLRFVGE